MEKNISINLYKNIIIALVIIIYFIGINILYSRLEHDKLLNSLKILSILFLSFGIIIIEIAYRKDNGKLGINAIETIFFAGHTLSIAHIVELKNYVFTNYILVSSYAFSIYFVFKALFIYTKERKDFLKSLSDIREIVSNEPVKKSASKKGERNSEIN